MLHVSTGTADLPSEHLVTTLVPGASWASPTKDLTPADRRALRHQLGEHVAAMHHVTDPGPFGCPAPGSPLTGPTWTVTYQRIITALLDDATRYSDAGGPVRLDEPTRRRLHLYRAHLALVMLVETAPRGTDGPADQPHNDAVAAWLSHQLDALPNGPSTTR